jgi:hypothetical protein
MRVEIGLLEILDEIRRACRAESAVWQRHKYGRNQSSQHEQSPEEAPT